jgi:hypothetical protein
MPATPLISGRLYWPGALAHPGRSPVGCGRADRAPALCPRGHPLVDNEASPEVPVARRKGARSDFPAPSSSRVRVTVVLLFASERSDRNCRTFAAPYRPLSRGTSARRSPKTPSRAGTPCHAHDAVEVTGRRRTRNAVASGSTMFTDSVRRTRNAADFVRQVNLTIDALASPSAWATEARRRLRPRPRTAARPAGRFARSRPISWAARPCRSPLEAGVLGHRGHVVPPLPRRRRFLSASCAARWTSDGTYSRIRPRSRKPTAA